jgi:thiol-disulfide isomerase/thioredoxin
VAAAAVAAALAAAAGRAGGCGHGAAGAAGGSGAGTGAPERTVQLNRPGAVVRIDDHLLDGYVTVVDFWSEHCGACVPVGGMLAIGTAAEPRVLIRKIDVGDGFTPVAQAYKIGALPHYRIYDKHRRLRHVLVGNDCVGAADLAKQLVAEP